MAYKVIQDHTHCPLLVYDGVAPRKMLFRVVDSEGNFVCKLDLWPSALRPWRAVLSEDELRQLDELLRFPRSHLLDGDVMVAHGGGPLRFATARSKRGQREFIVYFTFFEKQPARYQCCVLAVIERT